MQCLSVWDCEDCVSFSKPRKALGKLQKARISILEQIFLQILETVLLVTLMIFLVYDLGESHQLPSVVFAAFTPSSQLTPRVAM